MEYDHFNRIVSEHKNSMILIGILVLLFVIIGLLVIEFYVRRKLDCPYFTIGKIRFSPTLLMLIPLFFVIVYFPVKISQCNYDINNSAYESYTGIVEYSESSIKLTDEDITIFVGKGHEIVPQGINYGTVLYSQKARVVVFYQPDNPN